MRTHPEIDRWLLGIIAGLTMTAIGHFVADGIHASHPRGRSKSFPSLDRESNRCLMVPAGALATFVAMTLRGGRQRVICGMIAGAIVVVTACSLHSFTMNAAIDDFEAEMRQHEDARKLKEG